MPRCVYLLGLFVAVDCLVRTVSLEYGVPCPPEFPDLEKIFSETLKIGRYRALYDEFVREVDTPYNCNCSKNNLGSVNLMNGIRCDRQDPLQKECSVTTTTTAPTTTTFVSSTSIRRTSTLRYSRPIIDPAPTLDARPRPAPAATSEAPWHRVSSTEPTKRVTTRQPTRHNVHSTEQPEVVNNKPPPRGASQQREGTLTIVIVAVSVGAVVGVLIFGFVWVCKKHMNSSNGGRQSNCKTATAHRKKNANQLSSSLNQPDIFDESKVRSKLSTSSAEEDLSSGDSTPSADSNKALVERAEPVYCVKKSTPASHRNSGFGESSSDYTLPRLTAPSNGFCSNSRADEPDLITSRQLELDTFVPPASRQLPQKAQSGLRNASGTRRKVDEQRRASRSLREEMQVSEGEASRVNTRMSSFLPNGSATPSRSRYSTLGRPQSHAHPAQISNGLSGSRSSSRNSTLDSRHGGSRRNGNDRGWNDKASTNAVTLPRRTNNGTSLLVPASGAVGHVNRAFNSPPPDPPLRVDSLARSTKKTKPATLVEPPLQFRDAGSVAVVQPSVVYKPSPPIIMPKPKATFTYLATKPSAHVQPYCPTVNGNVA